MAQAASDAVGRDLHGFVDAFESAWRRRGSAEVADHLPAPDHPLYRLVLCEIVRVDLELHWSSGQPKRLEEYKLQFPALFDDPDAVRQIALEECRLRRQAGEEPDLDDYLRRFGSQAQDGISLPASGDDESESGPPTVEMSDDAPRPEEIQRRLLDAWCASVADQPEVAAFLDDFRQADPAGASRVAQAVSTLPEVGQEFLGFRLLAELGRGAFGRVFLARQSALANRLVALKIATDLFAESQTLAQLQHTNIVPIYSLHRAGSLQAVCMPFFGAATFGDVVKNLEKTRSVPASGKTFVSTLNQRHSVANPSSSSARGEPGASAIGAPPVADALAGRRPTHRRSDPTRTVQLRPRRPVGSRPAGRRAGPRPRPRHHPP